MYGRIGKLTAVPGQRAALVAILLRGSSDLPGCLSYVVAEDADDEDTIWVTEVWDSAASHRASLDQPSVREAISEGRLLIAGVETVAETRPAGGQGLPS